MFKKTLAYLAAGFAALSATAANATILTDAQAAVTGAGGDALTVGGYVIAAVGGLIVVGLVLGMMKKL